MIEFQVRKGENIMDYTWRDEESCSSSVPTEPPSEIEMLAKKIADMYVIAKDLKNAIAKRNNQYFGLETEKESEVQASSLFCNVAVMLDFVEESMRNAFAYIKKV
jgi:hypothetical protein